MGGGQQPEISNLAVSGKWEEVKEVAQNNWDLSGDLVVKFNQANPSVWKHIS
jgi:hypothetical protein